MFVVLASVFLFDLDKTSANVLSGSLYLLAPFVACFSGLVLIRTYGFNSPHGRAFSLFVAGIGSIFIGETISFVYSHFLNMASFASLADVFYLTAYPLIFGGLIYEYRICGGRFSLLGVMVVATVFILLAAGIFSLIYDPNALLIEKIVALGYGLGDLLVFLGSVLALLTARHYQNGRIFRPWFFIASATILVLLADILYLYFISSYENGDYWATQIDLLWIAGDLMLAYGLLSINFMIRDIQKRLSLV